MKQLQSLLEKNYFYRILNYDSSKCNTIKLRPSSYKYLFLNVLILQKNKQL